MNKRNVILAYIIIWLTAFVALAYIVWPLLNNPSSLRELTSNKFIRTLGYKETGFVAKEEGDNYFYEKKVFIRHYKNDFNPAEPVENVMKTILVPKTVKKVNNPVPATPKTILSKQNSNTQSGGFSIKPVPNQ